METEVLKMVALLAEKLTARDYKLTTAESCTGGGLSYALTEIPGASRWFHYGFVTYSNQAKVDLLNVSHDVLKTFGAVSEETAREMALGALDKSDADVSVAITGIAGPEGGSAQKPVGTVWIAIAKRDADIQLNHYVFTGDRTHIREKTIKTALNNLLNYLETE